MPFLPEHSFHAPTPSPQGLPGLAGAWSLRACELTLGTELQGTPEPELAGMIPKPVRLSFILPGGIFRPGVGGVGGGRDARQVEPVCGL